MVYSTREQYLEAMKSCPQFERFKVEPQWTPNASDIAGFIHDEVVRQYHNPALESDGGVRIAGMASAWSYAKACVQTRPNNDLFSIDDILIMAVMIEPVNDIGFRKHEVRIGRSLGAPNHLVPQMMDIWIRAVWENVDRSSLDEQIVPSLDLARSQWSHYRPDEEILNNWRMFCAHITTVDDAYLSFELIHPFADGNGRVGKILANWLASRLDNPWLMRDWFGAGNP